VKSTILAVALAMMAAALYAFQNAGEVTVKFLIFERLFPQGIWEVLLFSMGAAIMWVVSLIAHLETRSKFRKVIRDMEKRMGRMEEERTSLLGALKVGSPLPSPGTPRTSPRGTAEDAGDALLGNLLGDEMPDREESPREGGKAEEGPQAKQREGASAGR
jgi:uncharacterized integral membrane protein